MGSNLKLLLLFLGFAAVLIFLSQKVSSPIFASQNIRFGNGYYTNLSGGGADIDGNIGGYSDEADCNTGSGVCNAKNRNNGQNYSGGYVLRYLCYGRVTNCDNSHGNVTQTSGQSYSQSIDSSTSCGQTVQLDVFDGGNGLHGFMTWYSGDCSSSSTPQPGISTVTTCNGHVLSQSQLESELRGANYPGPWGDLGTELGAYNRAACPGSTPVPAVTYVYQTPYPTPTPVVTYVYSTPYPTPAPQTIVVYGGVAPTTTTSTASNIIYYFWPSPPPAPVVNKTVYVYPSPASQQGGPTPIATSSSKGGVTTLPKTGSPISEAAYFLGLVPVGFFLRKIGSIVS